MRAKPPVRTRSVVAMCTAAVLVSVAALVVVLASKSSAAPSTLPLPLPVAGVESLVGQGVTIEGPLVNNLNLPQLK
jgi:hypothetical protein